MEEQYFDKPNFDKEYFSAIFYNSNFNKIPKDEAKNVRENITVSTEGYDLICPLGHEDSFEIIYKIQEADKKGPTPFVTPLVIVKTDKLIRTLGGFENNKPFVSLARNKEEFYTILNDTDRKNALKKYLKSVCAECKSNTQLNESSIVFKISQINKKFLDYLVSQTNKLKPIY